MKKTIVFPILFLLCFPCWAFAAAEEGSFTDAEERGMPADYEEVQTNPQVGEGIQKHAEDAQSGAQKNFGVQPIHDNEVFSIFRGDRLEYRLKEGQDNVLWDVQAWIGRDYNKLWFKSEGTWLVDKEKFEEAETELFFSRNIASFWDFQIGARHDFMPGSDRTFAAFGFQGLAPYWFEVEATAYVSEDGDISANIELEYDLLFSQRLIFQPRFETNLAIQEVEKYDIGEGLNDITLGARLRYEIRREFAPYIGISWTRKIGETAHLVEKSGGDIESTAFVAGVRFWF